MQDCFLTPVSSCIPRLDIELFTVCYVQEWSCWCWGISTLLRSFPITKKMTNYPSLPIGWRWKWVRGLWELCGWKHRHRIVRHLRRGCWRERESVTLCNRIVTQLPDHICPTLLMVAAKNCELVYFCARIRNYYASEIQGLDSYGGGGGFLRTVFSGAFTWGHLVKLGQFYINDERKRSKTNTWIKTSCLIRTKVIAAHKSHHAAMAELHYRKV